MKPGIVFACVLGALVQSWAFGMWHASIGMCDDCGDMYLEVGIGRR